MAAWLQARCNSSDLIKAAPRLRRRSLLPRDGASLECFYSIVLHAVELFFRSLMKQHGPPYRNTSLGNSRHNRLYPYEGTLLVCKRVFGCQPVSKKRQKRYTTRNPEALSEGAPCLTVSIPLANLFYFLFSS